MARTQQQREELGSDLVALRMDAGYKSISELASTDIGISSKTIGNAEAGRPVSEQTIHALRSFLLARIAEKHQARVPEWGQGLTLDSDRYEKAHAQLRAWLVDADEEGLHPPTSALWLWSPGQLTRAAAEQVEILETHLSDQIKKRYQEMDAFGRMFGHGDDNEQDPDDTPTMRAGASPADPFKGRPFPKDYDLAANEDEPTA